MNAQQCSKTWVRQEQHVAVMSIHNEGNRMTTGSTSSITYEFTKSGLVALMARHLLESQYATHVGFDEAFSRLRKSTLQRTYSLARRMVFPYTMPVHEKQCSPTLSLAWKRSKQCGIDIDKTWVCVSPLDAEGLRSQHLNCRAILKYLQRVSFQKSNGLGK